LSELHDPDEAMTSVYDYFFLIRTSELSKLSNAMRRFFKRCLNLQDGGCARADLLAERS
jgi:hypothetical protein